MGQHGTEVHLMWHYGVPPHPATTTKARLMWGLIHVVEDYIYDLVIYLTSLQATTETPFHLHVGERLGTCRGRITGWHIKLHIVATVVDLEIPQDYSNSLPCLLECFVYPSLVSWSNHIALKGGEGQKSLGRETSLLVWQHSNSNSSNCPSVCQYVCPPISSPSH